MSRPRSPADYAPLPTSTTTSSLSSPLEPPQLDFPISSRQNSRWRKAYYALGGCTVLLLFSSLFIVPEEVLPTKVSSAVGASREAFEAAKVNWGWESQEELEEELKELEEEVSMEDIVEAESQESGVEVEAEDEAGEELTTSQDVECSSEGKKLVGDPTFWTIKASESTSNIYSVAPRNPLPIGVSRACLSQAVFSARLVSFADSLSSTPDSETLYSLPTPVFVDTLGSYHVEIPSNIQIPKQRYELQVTLEFGFYPRAIEGRCGDSAKVCEELAISTKEGEQLEYIGKRIEVQDEVKMFETGTLESGPGSRLCSDLSSLDGYWSSLSYNPTNPVPCSLFSPTFPTPFNPSAEPQGVEKVPLWIHFVGDSNTRNMYSQFLNSLGNGHKISAPKVMDSKTHNGTHASFASRWSTGQIPKGDGMPDFIVTWSWWYQTTPLESESPSPAEEDLAWKENVEENRDDLLRLVDTNLADYLSYAKLGAVTKQSPSISDIASTLRPHRTYLSLGSHSERLSVPGSTASLDFLLDETTGLSRSKRDISNLRIFTTTHVNPTYIPLDRFPHQDLVRNNAFISAKNSLTRSRPEFIESVSEGGGGGRIINVEALTEGITVDAEWMKPGKKGRSPDAVHFREEVYNEWVKLVWTDLVQGLGVVLSQGSEGDTSMMMKRWVKRRIEDWDDEEEFQ